MKVILSALILSFVIEFVCVYSRLVWHKRSDSIQKKLHLPRIHHSYPGLAILLIDYIYLQNEWLFVLGFSLIFSDLVHHLIFEPFIKKRGYDVGMKHHHKAREYVSKLPAAVALIVVGVAALLTPFTPGSWLALVGAGMVVGKSPDTVFATLKKILKLKK